jgi:Glycogen recognition site of AMP-activated protein kinase
MGRLRQYPSGRLLQECFQRELVQRLKLRKLKSPFSCDVSKVSLVLFGVGRSEPASLAVDAWAAETRMNERLNRYLDGELRREQLTPDELQEVATPEAIINEIERSYKSIDIPDLTARVMKQLPVIPVGNPVTQRQSVGEQLKHAVGWFWRPRLIRLRPAYGILAVVALLLIIVLPNSEVLSPDRFLRTSVGNADVSPLAKVFVQFRLDAPQASKVRLAGSFTGWEPTYTLEEITPGVWSILIPLDPGVHNYAFVVDGGQWIADPAAPAVDDGFGGVNSRLSVLLPTSSSHL